MKRATRDEYVVRTFHTIILSRSIIYPNKREREREFNGIVFGIFDKLEEYEVPVINK